MKKIILITLLSGFVYTQCDESNYESYYPNMAGCNLSGANLVGVILNGANLEGAQFENADLEGIRLSDANLAYTNFEGANLHAAYLSNSICWNANFTNADLSLMSSSNADFLNADFTGADMYGSYWGAGCSNENPWTPSNAGSSGNLNMSNLCNLVRAPSGDVCLAPFIDDNQDNFDDASFSAGVSSVDPQSYYDNGYGDGYLDGFAHGQFSVDTQSYYNSGYDAGYDIGAATGDVNNDGSVDVADIVLTVNIILGLGD